MAKKRDTVVADQIMDRDAELAAAASEVSIDVDAPIADPVGTAAVPSLPSVAETLPAPTEPATWQEEAAAAGHPDLVAFFDMVVKSPPLPKDLPEARASLLRGVEQFSASGHFLVAGRFEEALKALGPAPVALPKAPVRGPAAEKPAMITDAERHMVSRGIGSLYAAERPLMRMTHAAPTGPDLRAEMRAMLGEYAADRPDMTPPVTAAHLTRAPLPAVGPAVAPGARPDEPVLYFEVTKDATYRTADGGVELKAGSVISTLTHNVDQLRAQKVQLVPCASPVRAPDPNLDPGPPILVPAGMESIDPPVGEVQLEPMLEEGIPAA